MSDPNLQSRQMFVARLTVMNPKTLLTVGDVLDLIDDCDMLAQRNDDRQPVVTSEFGQLVTPDGC